MQIHRRRLLVATALLAACGSNNPPVSTNPSPDIQPLGGLVGQPVLFAPAQTLKVAAELGWTGLPKPSETLAALDAALTDTLRDRVGNQQWIYADAIIRAAAANPTYATDPHQLAIQPLRTVKLQIDTRLTEPLASQVRTMLALHDGRLVLLPVELRFDHTPAGTAHPVLRLVLVDPRSSVIRWFGDVDGIDLTSYSPSFAASLASRVANLFVAPR